MDKLISTKEDDNTSWLQRIGEWIIIIGIGLLIFVSWADVCKDHLDHSKLAATGFLMIMLGISFIFPSMLQCDDGISTMRVVVYIIVSVFITLVIKDGWNTDKLVSIDPNWMYIILTALGGKTVQSYTEALKSKYAADATKPEGSEQKEQMAPPPTMKTPNGVIKQ